MIYIAKYIIFLPLILTSYLLIKNARTYYVRSKITQAIYKYKINKDLFNDDRYSLSYENMEDYNKTLLRLWDWGYKRIVSKEIYDKIKDYIK